MRVERGRHANTEPFKPKNENNYVNANTHKSLKKTGRSRASTLEGESLNTWPLLHQNVDKIDMFNGLDPFSTHTQGGEESMF